MLTLGRHDPDRFRDPRGGLELRDVEFSDVVGQAPVSILLIAAGVVEVHENVPAALEPVAKIPLDGVARTRVELGLPLHIDARRGLPEVDTALVGDAPYAVLFRKFVQADDPLAVARAG